MSDNRTVTIEQAFEEVLAQLDGPIAVDELYGRVLTVRPSQARDPRASLRQHMRYEALGRSLISLDKETVVPLRIALRGVRFRISLSRMEADQGVLIVKPAFDYLLRGEIDPAAVRLLSERGQRLPAPVVPVRVRAAVPIGPRVVEQSAFNLGRWFRTQGVRRNDSLLVTIEDWESGTFRLEHEPAKRSRKSEIEERDRELADVLFGLLEESRSEQIYGYVAIPTAYARLSEPGGYPGSHWIEVLERDPRMSYDGWAIHYSNWRSPLEAILFEEEPPPGKAFSAAEGRQVYRFKAALWHRAGLWRRIEIQGEQTLAEFDGILRHAFEHDTFDHLGGFWKRVRRGKSRRFREVDLGTVNPFEGGEGAEVAIAGLELEPGDQLKYVYDFGDWIEHKITLEEIVEPEAGAEYPRVVGQNRPQYKNCVSCAAEGRTTRATWICLECSNERQEAVRVCEECLERDHEDHYVEEILY